MGTPTPSNQAELAEALAAALAAAVEASVEQLVAVHVGGAQPHAPAQLDRWLSVAEVAELVGVSERTVHRALRSGALLGHRAGGAGSRWHIRPEAVTAWVEPQPAAPPSRPAAPAAPRRPPGTSTPRRSVAERAQTTKGR
jgi:excisionase family DNA binding protein